ncbi:hypothetical protein [Micromonospora sp. HM5-17]|uniref:hypothetical protein n=1 Tax=Micromonospora sp. HM5-17 TaxID=2487710 RepID=UPI000F4A4D10|nr:hypothetical protein [Micromonospora sp. HM5-17]ROT28136.1 hypothetical protein EF879_21200 [Micromonospora sp. HM5-17]
MVREDEPSALAYTARRVARHLRWARTEGIRRLVEEDRLNPVERVGTALRKRRWRARHGVPPGTAVPVYLVGLQRSGTNMLVRGLDAAPEFEVRNENDRTIFHRFTLRSDEVLRAAILRSRHAYVLVKPLCDSHRVDELLALPGLAPGRALWVYRDVADRARSEVAKFGDANLRALRAIADGTIGRRWPGQRLDAETVALIRGLEPERMDPYTGAALFWYVRNSLFFSLGLDRRDDVLLCRYESLVADPAGQLRRLCAFLDFRYDPRLHAHIAPRSAPALGVRRAPSGGVDPLPIDPRVRARCAELAARLDPVAARPVPGDPGTGAVAPAVATQPRPETAATTPVPPAVGTARFRGSSSSREAVR